MERGLSTTISGGGGRGAVNPPAGGLDPNGIHRRAAEMALEEKSLEVEQQRLQNEKSRQAIQAADILNKTAEQERINNQYKGDMAVSEDWRKRGREQEENAFNQAMLGVHMGDPNAVKTFINQFGSPTSNVQDIIFGPPDDPGVIVKYEDGKSSLFKDKEEFQRGFMFFMSPKLREAMEKKKTTGTSKQEMSPGQAADLDVKARKAYKEEFTDIAGETRADAPDKEAWIEAWKKDQTETAAKTASPKQGSAIAPTPPAAPKNLRATPGAVEVPPKQPNKREGVDPYGTGEKLLVLHKEPPQRPQGLPEEAKWDSRGFYVLYKDGKPYKVKPKEGAQGKQRKIGSSEFTDPKTGKKMRRIHYADGTSETKEI